jgi:hypothetical protein
MPKIAERDDFCQEEAVSKDWLTSSHVTPLQKKNSRRMHEQMWEMPQATANVCVLEAKKSLEERFLLQGRVARTAAIWPIKAAERAVPSRIDRLVPEIHEVVRESRAAGAVPVNEDTKRMAIKFAAILPSFVPVPEIAADPDGEVSFDWLGSSHNVFSVSVDQTGRLAYAGKFSEGRKINGVEQLSDVCPPVIILGIEKAAS